MHSHEKRVPHLVRATKTWNLFLLDGKVVVVSDFLSRFDIGFCVNDNLAVEISVRQSSQLRQDTHLLFPVDGDDFSSAVWVATMVNESTKILDHVSHRSIDGRPTVLNIP